MRNKVLELYRSGLTSREVARRLNIGKTTVLRWLGTNTRSNADSIRKYQLNESFFDKIKTEKQAYWLGFLLADGSIQPCGRKNKALVLKCTLQRRDKGHLQKFITDIDGSHPLRYLETTKAWLLRVGSKHLCKTLVDSGWNFFKRRGNTNILEKVPQNLRAHLIRGLVDGDGSVGFMNKLDRHGTRRITPLFTYTDRYLSIVRWVRKFLSKKLKISFPKPNIGQGCFNFRCQGRNCILVCDYLYSHASIFLDRKYQNYLEMLSHKARYLLS